MGRVVLFEGAQVFGLAWADMWVGSLPSSNI